MIFVYKIVKSYIYIRVRAPLKKFQMYIMHVSVFVISLALTEVYMHAAHCPYKAISPRPEHRLVEAIGTSCG